MNICRLLWVFSLFLLLSATNAFASNVQKIVLPNGLTVLIEEMPSVDNVSIYAYIKTGSATERPYLGAGISHFVEHMLFKGTTERGEGQIAKEVKALGGEINAQTSFDYTMYTLDLPKEKFNQGLDIISDMVMHSVFNPAALEREREVIHGEMRLYHDRPERVLLDLLFKTVYIQHPYRHPAIGYTELFDQITRDQVYNYYKARYIPNNMIISIAGPVDARKIIPLIRATFKDFKQRPYPDRLVNPEPTQITPRTYAQEYPTPLYRFSLAYQSVGILDTNLYALDVLSMALGQGDSSRLYKELYLKQKLVDSINSSDFTPQDKGIFEIDAVLSKDNVQSSVQIIKSLIEEIKKKGLSAQELEKTKRQVLSQYIFSNQTSHSLAYRNATDEAMTGDVHFSEHYVDGVNKVTNEDIKRVANEYLKDQGSTLVVLTPQKTKATPKLSINTPKAVTRKIVLANGLTILLHEDKTTQVVAIQALVNAGTRREDPKFNGLAQLTANVWTKGTKEMNQEALALTLESRGMSLDSFAGRNTIGLKLDLLPDDMPLALNVLEDLIKNPSFEPRMIEQERQQMYAVIDERDDDITAVTFKEMLQTLFLTNPFRLDPLGSKKTLSTIKQSDVLSYYHRYVAPNNMVISVVGRFDSIKALESLKTKFGSFKRQTVNLPPFSEGPQKETRAKDLFLDKEQAIVSIAFQAPSVKSKDRFAMETIDDVLGSDLTGRLFVSIRDKLGKAYTLGSQYVPGIDTGVFFIYVLTTPDKVGIVKSIVGTEIESLRNKSILPDELAAAKNYLIGNLSMSLDTPSALANKEAMDELYGLGYDFHQRYRDLINAVTVTDVQRVAHDYLDSKKAAIVITMPKKKIE